MFTWSLSPTGSVTSIEAFSGETVDCLHVRRSLRLKSRAMGAFVTAIFFMSRIMNFSFSSCSSYKKDGRCESFEKSIIRFNFSLRLQCVVIEVGPIVPRRVEVD